MADGAHPQGSLTPAPELSGRARQLFFTPAIGWLRDILFAIVLALIIIAFVYQPVKVEGTSMAPYLSDQERIFINKFTYQFGPIQRGDVVVFRYPLDPKKSFIKRVVGLPGETVEIRRGLVYVNGNPLRENYLPADEFDRESYSAVTLPADHFFVLGDRRRSSNDSRAWGPVHRSFIYGKAVFAYWPLERFGPIETVNGDD